jgi:hypothetical protein
MDPLGIGLVGFGFYKLIQFITKEDEPSSTDKQTSSSYSLPKLPYQTKKPDKSIGNKEIPYNFEKGGK